MILFIQMKSSVINPLPTWGKKMINLDTNSSTGTIIRTAVPFLEIFTHLNEKSPVIFAIECSSFSPMVFHPRINYTLAKL